MYGNNLDVTLLGITKDNPYFDAKVTKSANRVILSSAAAEKYQLGKGDKIILTDEEEERDYAFTVDGVTNYSAGQIANYPFLPASCIRSYPAKRLKNHRRFL